MRPLWELPRDVRQELDRLHAQELKAWNDRDLVTATTCRLLWCELYLKASGLRSPVLPNLSQQAQSTPEGQLDPRPRWRREVRARPLVAVIERRAEKSLDFHGKEFTYWVEVLACGHEHDAWDFWPGQTPPKRRRCAACGRIRVSQDDRKRAEVIPWPEKSHTTVSGVGND